MMKMNVTSSLKILRLVHFRAHLDGGLAQGSNNIDARP